MKKFLIIFCSIVFPFNTLAYEFNNEKEYTIKNKSIHNTPEIMEFFSFFCPYCYELEKKYNIRKLINTNIKKNIKIQTYHVNFFGGDLSFILTKAWIIAQQIGIEEEIMLPIFKGVQETHTINNIDSIKKIFKKKSGIDENQFNEFWNSLTLKILVQKKNEDVKKSKLDYVPIMIIKGKYIIDYSKLDNTFKNDFSKKYIRLIQFLTDKK